MEEAERLCDRIAIIDHGKIIASGTKDELVQKTLGTREALTIDAGAADSRRPQGEARPARRDGRRHRRCNCSVENPAEQIRELLGLFHSDGVPVRDLTLKSATLEQVFLQLTGRELRE